MSRYHSYVNTARAILKLYQGKEPFSDFTKKFFSKEKKYGGRDRKIISSLCYYYYRLGGSMDLSKYDERILSALFLSTVSPNELLQGEKPDWNELVAQSLPEKLSLLQIEVESIFPLNDELSEDVDHHLFNTSFLVQPDVFVRVRPGHEATVKNKLRAAQVEFTEVNQQCIAVPAGTKLEQVVEINKEVVIQDLNSQRVGELMQIAKLSEQPTLWDCCAASGGKSIMAYDILSNISLTVSDVRQSIIKNLRDRFEEAGLKNFKALVIDLQNTLNMDSLLNSSSFDLVICDAPCSGSGTWGRTPEQLVFFKTETIKKYNELQKSIVSNTVPFVKKGGYFLYITCSVFKRENEEVVEFIGSTTKLQLIQMQLYKGYEIKADTMFAALFRASNS